MLMQNAIDKAEEFIDHLKEYINNRIYAVKLQAAATTSRMLSNLIATIVVAAIGLVFAIFISMAAAYALAAWTGLMWLGFLIVSGVWLVIAIVVWTARESLLRYPIMNRMLREMFNHEEDPQHN